MDAALEQLKALVRQPAPPADVYAAGLAYLAGSPGHEYASFVTASSAYKLGQHEAALRHVAAALARKPDHYGYLSVRANALLKAGRPEAALPDLQRMAQLRPEVIGTWKALLKIRHGVRPDLVLPRNAAVLADELGKAFTAGNWTDFERVLAELAGVEPLSHRYWKLLADDFFGRLPDAPAAWRQFQADAAERFADSAHPIDPLVDKDLPAHGYLGYFSALVRQGDVDRVLGELDEVQRQGRSLPAALHVEAAELLVRNQRHRDALDLLDRAEAGLAQADSRLRFPVLVHRLRWSCRVALLEQHASAGDGDHGLADALVGQLEAIATPDSPQLPVLQAFCACWEAIRARGDRVWTGLDFDHRLRASLQALVAEGRADGEPLSVVQLTAGDAPRLAELAPALADADVIGLPGPLQLARDLRGASVVKSVLASPVELDYLALFGGVRAMLDAGQLPGARIWVDESFDAAPGAGLVELRPKAWPAVPQHYTVPPDRDRTPALGPHRRLKLEERNPWKRDPLFIHDHIRMATATSVKLLDPQTLVCCSFVGRRAYLVRFDYDRGTHEILDSIDTTFEGVPVETDCCDVDAHGNLITSNLYTGGCSLYRCEAGRIRHVRDLPMKVGGFAHGIKFYRPGVLALTPLHGPTGVHFFDSETCKRLLHVPIDCKTQDVFFLSPGRMVVVGTIGAPRTQGQVQAEMQTHTHPPLMYDSEVHLIDFSLDDRTFEVVAATTLSQVHLDNGLERDGLIYLTDQYNNRLILLDAQTLEPAGAIPGFDFPHGIDIRFDYLAVSNYGSNDLSLQRFLSPAALP